MPKYIITIKDKSFLMVNDEMTPIEPDKVYEVIEKRTDKRTVQANRALHLYCKQVAEALNDAGLDMKQVIKADVQWSMLSVKEYMWKTLQKAITHKDSTTQITSSEIDIIYHTMNRLLGEKFSIHVPFPNIEELLFNVNHDTI